MLVANGDDSQEELQKKRTLFDWVHIMCDKIFFSKKRGTESMKKM